MRTLAVTSGKGGVGKTSLTANLCIALAKLGKRVVAFDGDLGLANLDILLGAVPEFTLQHVVAEQKRLPEVVCRAPGGIGFLGGASAISTLMHAGPKRLVLFFEQFDELAANTDYLVIDTSAGADNRVRAFLGAADTILLVATPDPASIMDAYAMVKIVTRKRADADFQVIVNDVSKPEEGHAVFTAIGRVAQNFLDKDLSYLGSVRRDVQVQIAARTRKPFVLANPGCPASFDVADIAKRVLNLASVKRDASVAERAIEFVEDPFARAA